MALAIHWLVFGAIVLGTLYVDLKVVGKKTHVIGRKEALFWSVVWISLALLFNVLVYFWYGKARALEYLTGYVIEKSLSVDNIFVFIMIFSYFAVDKAYHHRVLFWGIMGAFIMRAVMIALGVSLIHRFWWVVYVFGAFLVFTGLKMAFGKEVAVHPENNPIVNIFRRFYPITKDFEGTKFFVRNGGVLHATPLFIVLLVVESSDLAFAVDSIPAILAITTDPFVVYTSNIFAILGLRALYFLLAGVMEMFRYLKSGLSLVLVFVGLKMLLANYYHISTEHSLLVVAGVLAVSVIASMPHREKGDKKKD